jgi:hypothetical protein
MSSDSFRRHTRACVDAAISRVFATHPSAFFERLLAAVRARSNFMSLPPRRRRVVQVDVLEAMLPFEHALVREPESWAGARGHPLAVIDSLASHLFGHYATPRFLASAWLGDHTEPREWFVAHAQGARFRTLALPLAMTRQMEHVFLHTPDHYSIEHALRRAEVIGLGGSPELADVIVTTRLGEQFDDPERWRLALAWLARCGDTVGLTLVRPLVDYLSVHDIKLRGRTFASMMRRVREWHTSLRYEHVRLITWPRTRWNGLTVPVDPTPREPRGSEWTISELLDNRELIHEGHVMRHCVATYHYACSARNRAIWSLRHRWHGEHVGRSVLTIDVQIATGKILQIRGKVNSLARGWPLELVRTWAAREGLAFHRRLIDDGIRLVA